MDIKIDIRPKSNNITLVVLRGEIGAETVNQFKDKIDAIINEGRKRLILDFQEVTYLNPIGLGVIAATLKKVKKDKGNLKLINLTPSVQELFEMTRLTKVFEIFDSEESAIKSFN
ncbi:MAG TPA: STAS domain-containing protein [Candidatus Rifleibacterium sp.]|nr:STAS domain-containing protein [Candidatus Rifleibacterium sp.]HPT48522.1 STAS domain-containing protein [Candidatus Rifleibacterium sp.]